MKEEKNGYVVFKGNIQRSVEEKGCGEGLPFPHPSPHLTTADFRTDI
jgi:hypothetical protein